MSYAVVWSDESPGRVWTLANKDGSSVLRSLSDLVPAYGKLVEDSDELLRSLAQLDGQRFIASAEVIQDALGWKL